MANIIIKSDERLKQEEYVRNVFGVNSNDKYKSDIASEVSALSVEAANEAKKMENTYSVYFHK